VFKLGGLTFRVLHAGPAHTPEDLMMLVEEDGVLFVGDLMFSGRIPFVGDAEVSSWISRIDRVLALKPRVVVGGHGPASTRAVADLALTRDCLVYLRAQIAAAFDEGLDFEAAYRRIDWSRYAALAGVRGGEPAQCLPDLPQRRAGSAAGREDAAAAVRHGAPRNGRIASSGPRTAGRSLAFGRGSAPRRASSTGRGRCAAARLRASPRSTRRRGCRPGARRPRRTA
jgi:hypothetical protein